MGYKEVVTFLLSTSIAVGCSSSAVEAGKIETTPSLTPTPNQNALVIDSLEDNSYLGTPGAIETQMVSTAVAADLEKSTQVESISPKAISSLVSISLWTDSGLVEASGNLAYLFGYPVILTSGHIHDYVDAKSAIVQGLSVKRLNISNPISLLLSGQNEAHVYNIGGYPDIGVFVITNPDEIEYLTNAIGIDQMLKIDDLRFDQVELGESVNGVCYPSSTYPDPYPFSGTVYEIWGSQIIVDNALTLFRCSGGGVFDSNGKYFASVSGGYHFDQFVEIDQSRWDDTFVSPLSSIGEAGLEQLIAQAVSK